MFKTAIILAGGKSTRMGEDKALLPFGDRPLIARMVDALREHFDDLILVTNHPERHMGIEDIRLVSDVRAGMGELGGIMSGLLASRGRHNLIVSCDLPFLNHLLLDYLWSLRNWGDVVVPLTHEGLSPMLAVYDRHVLPAVVEAVDGGQREPMALYPQLKMHYVREDELVRYDPLLRSFRHVSTPEEYRAALAEFAAAPQEAP